MGARGRISTLLKRTGKGCKRVAVIKSDLKLDIAKILWIFFSFAFGFTKIHLYKKMLLVTETT